MWMRWGLGRGIGRVGVGNGGRRARGGCGDMLEVHGQALLIPTLLPFYRHTPLALGRV